jgi:hypothetical protein
VQKMSSEVLQRVDTVEKLDFLPRSQFLRQQAGFKKQCYGLGRKADFSLCGGRSELATVAWRYLPCMTKLRFSDVPHFPSFSTVSVKRRKPHSEAVGTVIAGRAPSRSVRAGFPHTAPTLGV